MDTTTTMAITLRPIWTDQERRSLREEFFEFWPADRWTVSRAGKDPQPRGALLNLIFRDLETLEHHAAMELIRGMVRESSSLPMPDKVAARVRAARDRAEADAQVRARARAWQSEQERTLRWLATLTDDEREDLRSKVLHREQVRDRDALARLGTTDEAWVRKLRAFVPWDFESGAGPDLRTRGGGGA